MYFVAVVDDEQSQRDGLAEMVERVGSDAWGDVAVAAFSGADELEAYMRDRSSRPVDIVLMDISLGGAADGQPDGIEAVRRLFPSSCGTQVIYVTCHGEYCTRVYTTPHVYFLLKPVNESELRDALVCADKRIRENRERPIGIRVGNAEYSVSPHDIAYAESRGRISRIHTERGVIESYLKLDELAARLPSRFVRCHKSYLVNLEYVWQFRSSQLELSTGDMLPVSQRRASLTRAAFVAYVR